VKALAVSPKHRDVLFSLMGQQFVRKYFPDGNCTLVEEFITHITEHFEPYLLHPPFLDDDLRLELEKTLRVEMLRVLKEKLSSAPSRDLSVTMDVHGAHVQVWFSFAKLPCHIDSSLSRLRCIAL